MRLKSAALLILLACICFQPTIAQAAEASVARAVAAARKYRQAHDAEIVRELVDLLSIPNVSADLENIRRNAEMLVQMMERRDIRARLISVRQLKVGRSSSFCRS